jgi:hypothetical protein
MLIRTFALCASLLATGCIAVPVGPDYYGDGYYRGGYAPSYYSGTVVYRDEQPRRYYYHERDRHHRSHRYEDDRDRRDRHGRAWD